MNELDASYVHPPQDEYEAAQELPPAYDSFEDAYAQWHAADKAKQATISFEPTIAAAEKELNEAKEILKDLKEKSERAFNASHTQRSSFSSLLRRFGKSKAQRRASQSYPDPTQSVRVDEANHHVDGIDVSRPSTSAIGSLSSMDGKNTATEKFKQAHGMEMRQDLIVRNLEEKFLEIKREEEALNDVASTGDRVWIQLRRMADVTLSIPEFAIGLGAATEKLESVENAYCLAKVVTADLTRARHAVQSSHRYFTLTLKTCDGVRGTKLSALGGDVSEFYKQRAYQEGVSLATKAQVCLNETFRVLEPHKHLIPADRMVDYIALKEKGLTQMAKIYNLMYGGPAIPTGVAGSVKLMLERQEAAFANLTYLAVWIQNQVPVCTKEEKMALTSRNDVRREVAALWKANIDRGVQL